MTRPKSRNSARTWAVSASSTTRSPIRAQQALTLGLRNVFSEVGELRSERMTGKPEVGFPEATANSA